MPEPILYALLFTVLFLSVTAITLSCISISMIVGFKNSTHTIEWKPLETPKVEDDPFLSTEDEDLSVYENPNKRKPKAFKINNPFPSEVQKEEEPFLDLDNPEVTANNW